jgi:hypothetical protein
MIIEYVLKQLAEAREQHKQIVERMKSIALTAEMEANIGWQLQILEHNTGYIFSNFEAELTALNQAIQQGLIDENLDAREVARFLEYVKQLAAAGVNRHDLMDMISQLYYRAEKAQNLAGYITKEEYRQKYGLSDRHLQVNQMFHRVIPIIELGPMIFVLDRPMTEGERLNLNSVTYMTIGEVAIYFKCDYDVARLLAAAVQANPAEPVWAQKFNKTTWYHAPDVERMKDYLATVARSEKKGHSLVSFTGLVWCSKCGKTWKTGPRNECDFADKEN